MYFFAISNNAVQTFSGGLVYHFYVFVLGGFIDVLKNASKVHTVFVTKLQETWALRMRKVQPLFPVIMVTVGEARRAELFGVTGLQNVHRSKFNPHSLYVCQVHDGWDD